MTTAKIKDLTPYARNSRTHSDEQVAQIAASIREFGFTAPVLYADGTVIAGHGRLMAAQRLQAAGHRIALPSGELLPDGMVPAIDCTGWTDAQKRAYVIADNKLALNAGWDDDMLRLELGELKDEGFDLDVVGFSAEELANLLPAGFDAEADMPDLKSGDREPFQQMTFTVHDEQKEQVDRAMSAAKSLGPFIGSPNENSNGNALARICEYYVTHHD